MTDNLDAEKMDLLSAIRQQPSPTRAQRLRRNQGIYGLGTVATLVVFWAVGGFRESWRDSWLVLATAGGTAVLAVVALRVAVGREVGGASWSARIGVILGMPLAVLVWKLAWSMSVAGGLDWDPLRPGLRCLGVSHLVGLPALLCLLLARQGTEPRQARLAAGALGAAAGAVGAFLVDLWCPVGHPLHLFLGHLLPMGSLTALGMILGWRLVVLR